MYDNSKKNYFIGYYCHICDVSCLFIVCMQWYATYFKFYCR